MILGGMDVSGDPESGNYKYMSIVLCTQEILNSILKILGSEQIHMSQIQNKGERDRIVSALKFDGRQSVAFCIRIGKNRIIDEIQSRRTAQKNVSKLTLMRTYNYILWHHIRDKVTGFLTGHKTELHHVDFQCDSDCDYFATSAGLRHADPGTVHMQILSRGQTTKT